MGMGYGYVRQGLLQHIPTTTTNLALVNDNTSGLHHLLATTLQSRWNRKSEGHNSQRPLCMGVGHLRSILRDTEFRPA
jgi:hypothetical protein